MLIVHLVVFYATSNAQETRIDSINYLQETQGKAKKHILKGEFTNAISKLEIANAYVIALNDDSLRASLFLDLAKLNYFINNYDKALYDIEKSILFYRTSMNNEQLSLAQTIKGLIYSQKLEFNKANESFKEADQLLTKINNEKLNAHNLLGKGKLAFEKGEYPIAINYFEAAIPFFKNNKELYKEAFALVYKAEALFKLSKTNNQISYQLVSTELNKALKIIDANSFKKLKLEYYRIASLIAFKNKNISEAEALVLNHNKLSKSLNEDYANAISKGIEDDLDIEKLYKIIETQKLDLDQKEKSISFTKWTTGLSIALIIILSLLTLSFYKNNNLRAKANNLLRDKNVELELAKEKAEKASLAKAQFLSTITHELRTPMYAVTGLTHLLMEENPTQNQKEHLQSLKFSGEYLLSLINNILDLNKLDANKVEIERTTFDLERRLKAVLVALKKSADDKNTKLFFEYDETIPQKLIGDSLKISQILINLVGNAVKFTENGSVFIRVKKYKETLNDVILQFEIEDNGVGISKKKQKSIFETFSQASLQVNRKFGGTGLGLSIVKNLLELLDSKIQLESNLGHGSKFWFNLSLGIAQEDPTSKIVKKEPFKVDKEFITGKKILIVEDNKINQMITRKILEKSSVECVVTDNGIDAVKMVKDNLYDLILMDIQMPGISGIEATQKVRQFNHDIPIIALTAVTIDENLDSFFKAGFNDIIPKPFKTEEFFEKIEKTLKESEKVLNS